MSSSRSVRVPYLALKHLAGSDQPVFFDFLENKVCGGGGVAELTNSNCWATPQGWVLVRSSSSTYLLDPHNNGVKIQLPHLPDEGQSTYCTCVLSDYPEPSSSCIVLLVETDTPVIWYCHTGGGGDDQGWVKHEFDIGTLPLPDLGDGCSEKLVISPVTACQGKFYFNCDFKEIGVLDFCPAPTFSSIAIRNAIVGPPGFRKVFMLESKQELYMVSLLSAVDLNVVYRVMVHKMDFSKQEWCQVDDIGDRVFLLSSWYFGASRSADDCGLERNCIYVVYPWNKCLMIFNVRDGTSKVQDIDKAPVSKQALWMLPAQS
ncbi:hypothetical protein ACP70R_005077 [Stipagrostis hirtigluma subsp. patula]